MAKTPAWQRKEGKDPKGGLNKKGVASYRRANPGSKLQTAVTTKPSKLKKGSKAAKRRKSFCARMKGMKKRLTSAKTARDPNSRINKALRKWNCKDGGIIQKAFMGTLLKKQTEKDMKMSPMLGGGAKSIMKKGGNIPKAGIGLIVPQKVIHKVGKKNFEKGKKLLGPLMGMMKKGGTIKDACYHKVKARYSVFPSAYASGAIAKCRKVGASNWGNKSKK